MESSRNLGHSRDRSSERGESQHSHIVGECEIPTCSQCEVYRQRLLGTRVSYEFLLENVIPEHASRLFVYVILIGIYLAASFIYCSRLVDVPLKQLYLENIIIAVTYYVSYLDLKGAFAIIFCGHFLSGFAATTKCLQWTVLMMIWILVLCDGFKFYVWNQTLLHLFYGYLASCFTEVHQAYYVATLLLELSIQYFTHLMTERLYWDDLLYLSLIAVHTDYFILTGEQSYCDGKLILLTTVLWIFNKHVKRTNRSRV